MKHAGHQQFASRIDRISIGSGNTFGTVYTGLQDVDTPKGSKVTGVTKQSLDPSKPSRKALMKQGFLQGLLRAGLCLGGFGLYLGVLT